MGIAYIALGSNLASPAGSPEATFHAVIEQLASLGQLTARSRFYTTEPVELTPISPPS